MKITFIVSGNIRSNFSYRALALAKTLHKLDHNVSIIAPKADKYNNFKSENINLIDGVKIIQPFQFATKRIEINLFPYIFSAAKAILQEKSDIIYIYKPTPISIVGFLAKLFYRTPIVLDMDDLGSEVMKLEGHPWYQRELTAWCERFAAKYADRIVVASTYLFDQYHRQFPSKLIHVMPNGAASDWFAPIAVSKAGKQIVFLGAVSRKNILEPLFDVFPNILKRHPDTKLLIIGDGKFLTYFKEKTRSLGIEKSTTFMGWLTIDDARARLHAGDIGYSYMPDGPTNRAASNMKVPQYMARGVVPFVSDIGDLPATVDFGKAGYICKANDIKALEGGLLQALEDKERYQKAEKARSFAAEKFNWDTLGKGFNEWLIPEKNNKKKNIYMVATSVPGDVGGGEIRNFNFIKQLAKRPDIALEVFCISNKDPDIARKEFESKVDAQCHVVAGAAGSLGIAMRAIFLKRVPPFMEEFKSSGLGDALIGACKKSLPDAIQIEQLQAYYCVRSYIPWLTSRGVKIIFDCHNIEFRVFNDSLILFSTAKKWIGKFLLPRLKKMEIEAAKSANAIFTCSTLDADFFKTYNPKTYIIPNGVDCSDFQLTEKKENQNPTLIFIGGVKYPPNGDAMEFYVNAIHSQVKAKVPEVQLLAIGTNKEWLSVKGIADTSIVPLGFVEDVRPYLSRAVIGICPVRYGSGTRIKILTYMAAGLPVVATVKGAEGVTYGNGHDIIITDQPEEFAESIIKLLSDKTYRDEIANNGRKFVLENYDWNVIGNNMMQIYQNELR